MIEYADGDKEARVPRDLIFARCEVVAEAEVVAGEAAGVDDGRQGEAATLLQSQARRRAARRKLEEQLSSRQLVEAEAALVKDANGSRAVNDGEAATLLQSQARRRAAQRHVQRRRLDRQSEANELATSFSVHHGEAATLLQSQVRKRAALCPVARLGCILGNGRGGVVPVSPLSNTAFSRLGLAR